MTIGLQQPEESASKPHRANVLGSPPMTHRCHRSPVKLFHPPSNGSLHQGGSAQSPATVRLSQSNAVDAHGFAFSRRGFRVTAVIALPSSRFCKAKEVKHHYFHSAALGRNANFLRPSIGPAGGIPPIHIDRCCRKHL